MYESLSSQDMLMLLCVLFSDKDESVDCLKSFTWIPIFGCLFFDTSIKLYQESAKICAEKGSVLYREEDATVYEAFLKFMPALLSGYLRRGLKFISHIASSSGHTQNYLFTI